MDDTAVNAQSSPLEIAVLVVGAGPGAATHITDMLDAASPGGFSVACALELRTAVEALVEAPADCVIVELESFRDDPLAAVDELGRAAPEAPILALARHPDDELALAVVRAGAQDYLIE